MKYIGVKILESAELMTRAKYVELRGWEMPKNEDPNEEVYLVEYEANEENKQNLSGYNGYVSMSPKDVFEKAYRPISGITFGLALEALSKGLKVTRRGWNGSNMWLMLIEGRTITDAKNSPFVDKVGNLIIAPHIDLFSAQEEQVVGWKPSNLDMLAEDWIIIG
jgi:hypothetical protein